MTTPSSPRIPVDQTAGDGTEPWTDPMMRDEYITDERVAAAFTGRRGDVRVLSGTRLSGWLERRVAAEVAAAREAWDEATGALIAQALEVSNQRLDAMLSAAINGRWDSVIDSDVPVVRRKLSMPEPLYEALKKCAEARGISISEAQTEAARAWVAAQLATQSVVTVAPLICPAAAPADTLGGAA